MIDNLIEYSDEDILDTMVFAAEDTRTSIGEYLRLVQNPLAPEALSQAPEKLRAIGNTLGCISEGLRVLCDRRNAPSGIVLQAAAQRIAGTMSDSEWTAIMARETLRHQGVENPTDGQIADRISELNTAASFVGGIPVGE
jgi:hypothetical protein